MLFRQNTRKTGNNAVEMQAFHDIAQLECFTDLNLFTRKYVFNVIQNWETAALQAYFLLAVMVEGNKSSRLRMAN